MSKELLGNLELNRVYQMDCLEGVKLIKDNSIDLINIDPPYVGIVNTDWDKKNVFTKELVTELHRVLKPSGSIYVWCGIGEKSRSLLDFIPILDSKFIFKDLITWKKQRGNGMRKGWLYTREELLWYVKDNKKFIWNKEYQYSDEERVEFGNRRHEDSKSKFKRYTNVWTDILEEGNRGGKILHNEKFHITQKPVKAIERTLFLHTKENDIVLDCFMGSGTTAVACERNNRKWIGFEIESECIEIINKRVEQAKSEVEESE